MKLILRNPHLKENLIYVWVWINFIEFQNNIRISSFPLLTNLQLDIPEWLSSVDGNYIFSSIKYLRHINLKSGGWGKKRIYFYTIWVDSYQRELREVLEMEHYMLLDRLYLHSALSLFWPCDLRHILQSLLLNFFIYKMKIIRVRISWNRCEF